MDQIPEVIVLARILTAFGFRFSLFRVGANAIALRPLLLFCDAAFWLWE